MKIEMLRSLIIFWLAAVALCGQTLPAPHIDTPRVGVVRSADGSIRPVLGVPGSFVVGESISTAAQSASFSDKAGIIAYQDHVAVMDADLNVLGERALSGPVIVGIIDAVSTAVAWLPETKTLLFWNGKDFSETRTAGIPDGVIWSIQRHGDQAVLMSVDLQITVNINTGNLIDCRAFAADELRLAAKAVGQNTNDLTLERMSSGFAHVLSRSDARSWVLPTTVLHGSEERIWELPAARGK
jgi:hypothetical protein